jgi:hypothetical protein
METLENGEADKSGECAKPEVEIIKSLKGNNEHGAA